MPATACIAFFLLFYAVLLIIHGPFLTLPFHWDELGQFIPAALDLFQRGAWIPRSAAPNVHPPGVMAYLAGVWALAGYSIPITRSAMLLLASAGLLGVLMLATELKVAPAFAPVALLCISPLFFSQAMLAQLDMPAMVFTCFALLFFLRERIIAAAILSTALVLIKETGLVVPLLFGGWLWFEKRRREAVWFLLPVIALAGWVWVVIGSTGHIFGNPDFAEYNVVYPLHPVRFTVALARRLYFLLCGNFHWIGTIGIVLAWRRSGVFDSRSWRVAGCLVAAHVLVVSALGGAVLERYLLPALPVLYIAMTAAWSVLSGGWWKVAPLAVAAGLLMGHFWNPFYSFSFESNLAFVDFVKLQKCAAEYLARCYPQRRITTTWPLAAALRRPEFGYTTRVLETRELDSFARSAMGTIDRDPPEILVLYSSMWDPFRLMQLAPVRRFWQRFYGYDPPVSPEYVQDRFRMRSVARWELQGLWIEIYAK
jgi:hypothetical protein